MSDLYERLRTAIETVRAWMIEDSHGEPVTPPYQDIQLIMSYARGMIPVDLNGHDPAAEFHEWDVMFAERREVRDAMNRYEFRRRGAYDWYVGVWDEHFVDYQITAESFPTERSARRWALRDAGYGHLIQ